MSRPGNVKALVNRHTVGFYDGLNASNRAPGEPEDRPRLLSMPQPVPMAEAIAEMAANDAEFREWRSAEILGDMFGRRG